MGKKDYASQRQHSFSCTAIGTASTSLVNNNQNDNLQNGVKLKFKVRRKHSLSWARIWVNCFPNGNKYPQSFMKTPGMQCLQKTCQPVGGDSFSKHNLV